MTIGLVDRLTDPEAAARALGLSRVHVAVLQHAAEGLSSRETAEAMSYSYDSIRDYRKQIIKRLGVANMTAAVAVAWRGGAIK